MKAEVKDQWVKDLRSGDYEQGGSYLDRTRDGRRQYCCLGVLCDQAVRAGVTPAPELDDLGRRYYLDDKFDQGKVVGEEFNQACSLPRKVAEWAGVPHEEGPLGADIVFLPAEDEEGYRLTAIGANDMEGLTFLEIADLIEQNVPAE